MVFPDEDRPLHVECERGTSGKRDNKRMTKAILDPDVGARHKREYLIAAGGAHGQRVGG